MIDKFHATESWKDMYPEASVGLLLMTNVGSLSSESLDDTRSSLQEELRIKFDGADRAVIRALPRMLAYNSYYRRFKKTYHVQLQLESVALKGRPIRPVLPLVDAMYLSELSHHLLTAGHDWDLIEPPLIIDVAKGDDVYITFNQKEQILQKGDMMISDAKGVISSIIYGPDYRTRITDKTRQVLYTTYAPPGISDADVREHLEDIESNVVVMASQAHNEVLAVITAS